MNLFGSKVLSERLRTVFKKSLDEIAYIENRKINYEEKLKRIDFHSLDGNQYAKDYRTNITPLDTTYNANLKDFYDYRRAGTENSKTKEYLIGGKRIIFDTSKNYRDYIQDKKIDDKEKPVIKGVKKLLEHKKEKLSSKEQKIRDKENIRGRELHNAFMVDEYMYNKIYKFLNIITYIKIFISQKEYYKLIPIYEFLIKFCFLVFRIITNPNNKYKLVEKHMGMGILRSFPGTEIYRWRNGGGYKLSTSYHLMEQENLTKFLSDLDDIKIFKILEPVEILNTYNEFGARNEYGEGRPIDLKMLDYVLFVVYKDLIENDKIDRDNLILEESQLHDWNEYVVKKNLDTDILGESIKIIENTLDSQQFIETPSPKKKKERSVGFVENESNHTKFFHSDEPAKAISSSTDSITSTQER